MFSFSITHSIGSGVYPFFLFFSFSHTFFITPFIFAFHPHFAFHDKVPQFITLRTYSLLALLTGADLVFSLRCAFSLFPLLLNRACRVAEIKKSCVG